MEVNGNGDYSLCSIINANKVLETRYLTMGALLSRLHFIYELFDNIFFRSVFNSIGTCLCYNFN